MKELLLLRGKNVIKTLCSYDVIAGGFKGLFYEHNKP